MHAHMAIVKESDMLNVHAPIAALVAASVLSACSGTVPKPLAPPLLDRLKAVQQTPASTGDKVYEGRVYSLDGRPEPLFRHERRVQVEGSAATSTHITHDPSGTVVVIQSAEHSPTYELKRADMIHGQTGASASVVVSNGRATFTLKDAERESVFDETLHDPIVAGPTMFGFILAHWDELREGVSIPIRFAVLERGETLGFVLDQVAEAEGRTTIRMKPTSFLVRLAVAATYFQFDTATRQIIEYTGRVPPLEQVDDRLQALDARVQYTFLAPAFR